MKQFLTGALIVASFFTAGATTIEPQKNPPAHEVMILLAGSGKSISLAHFVKLTPREYKQMTGINLGLAGRIKFKIAQGFGKKLIGKDGTIDPVRMKKKFGFFDRWHWHWGGCALGLLVIIGPIIALFFRDEYKWDRFWTALTVSSALVTVLLTMVVLGI